MNTPITVSELNREIKLTLAESFPFVYVVGEISNFKLHGPTGNYYFVVKDEKSQISCVMWSSRSQLLHIKPEDGMKVLIKGRVTVYEGRGTYQIEVFDVEPAGIGELQAAFEKLKIKLHEEGLFNEIHKKQLPEYPCKVGIITSETGAVIKDFCRVAENRYPCVEIYLYPVNVQGASAPRSIIKAINLAHLSEPYPDVLVLARGGGSLEDLWAFNDEVLARTIFQSEIPIVSAIGHEVDFTIADFVADLRAPTPSAAAEMIFPDKRELLERINQFEYYINAAIIDKISNLREDLNSLAGSYVFNRPMDILNENKYRMDDMDKSLERVVSKKFYTLNNSLDYLGKILKNIDPETTLRRGYSIVKKQDKVISRAGELKTKDDVELVFHDGSKKAEIK